MPIALVWLGLMSYLELLKQQVSSVVSTEMVAVCSAILKGMLLKYVLFFNIVEKY